MNIEQQSNTTRSQSKQTGKSKNCPTQNPTHLAFFPAPLFAAIVNMLRVYELFRQARHGRTGSV